MESLPLLVMDKIAEQLTPYELTACSAVSVGWRDAFNQDRLWRPHCNKDTAEYLETAESRVEPRFESPESEDSTLSPVCRWRMCYMRETHLRSNWRHGRYVKENISVVEKIQNKFCVFVSDDYVLLPSGRKVTLWNVRGSPVYIGEPIHLLFESEGIRLLQMINSNMVLIVQKLSVQVYCFKSILDKTWELKHVFFLDGTQSVSPSEAVSVMPIANEEIYAITNPTVIGNIFVGYSYEDQTVLHIWNVEEGKKLKRVECKITPRKYCNIWTIVKSDKPSLDIVVGYFQLGLLNSKFHVYIYSLTHLDFLPFHETYDINKHFKMDCVLQDRFLGVTVGDHLYIYNYVTSQLLHTIPTITKYVIVNNQILFYKQIIFYKIFNTTTLEPKSVRVTNNTKVPPLDYFGKSLYGRPNFDYTYLRYAKVWEMGRNPMAEEVTCLEDSDFNRSKTKLIVKSYRHTNYFICEYFW